MMVQTTHFGNLYDVAFRGWLDSSRLRGVFAKREVNTEAQALNTAIRSCPPT